MNREQAKKIVFERDQGCVATECHSPCMGPLDMDEGVKRSQGSDPTDPNQGQTLCRSVHTLFDNVMPKAKKILGYGGQENLEWEKFLFYQETPNADWDAYRESWRRCVFAEYAYMIGQGNKPETRYHP